MATWPWPQGPLEIALSGRCSACTARRYIKRKPLLMGYSAVTSLNETKNSGCAIDRPCGGGEAIAKGVVVADIECQRRTLRVFESIHTLRFELFNRAGLLVRPDGRAAAPRRPSRAFPGRENGFAFDSVPTQR
jgi:hypothetical protein